MNNLTILIVDDDESKAEAVCDTLLAIGIEPAGISTVSNATAAKRLLREQHFNLLVLDIALPLRADGDPEPRGGLDLLDELKSRDIYMMPDHIIGLTAYPEIYEIAGTQLGTELWSVLFYEASSNNWVERIEAKIRHILRSQNTPAPSRLADIAIITALQDPELDAVLSLPWNWTIVDVQGDASIYHKGRFVRTNGEEGTVIACRSPNMGMSSAAIQAAKVCMHFKPGCLVMTGICAGTFGEIQLGDVILANPTWDYGAGKYTDKDGEKVFEEAQYQQSVTTRIRGIAERLARDSGALQQIKEGFFGKKPDTTLTLAIGPLASGAAVVADANVYQTIKQQHRKLLGIDMEAYGIMLAGEEMPYRPLETFVLKGVSDFADSKKNDQFRHYAAYVSAMALQQMVEKYGL